MMSLTFRYRPTAAKERRWANYPVEIPGRPTGLGGLQLRRFCRRTQTVVELHYALDAGLAAPDGRLWATVCEHGATACHRSRSLAILWLAEPDGWCERCANPDPVVGYEVFIWWADAVELDPQPPLVSLGPDKSQAYSLGAEYFHTTTKDINLRPILASELDRLRNQTPPKGAEQC